MPIRVPPGRAGRIWLRERLAVAERAADLLEEKRRALVAESRRLGHLADATRTAWIEGCREAELWAFRAGLVGGQRQFDIAAHQVTAPAEARIGWRSTMGLAYPWEVECHLGAAVDVGGIGDTSALAFAAEAHRMALTAALEHAAIQRALDLVANEIDITTRRLRAIERRWVPRLGDRLRDVERRLDERDREDIVRARWARDRMEVRA